MELTVDLEVVQQWLFREARYADEHDYAAWESLWTDDGVYLVPAGEGDPARQMSVIYDNRTRISTRIKQLETGRRHSQAPPSSLCRVVSNVEILGAEHVDSVGNDIAVTAKFVLVEWRGGDNEVWAGRSTYRLRPVEGELRMAYKRVDLVNRAGALPTLSFLI